MKYGKAFGAVKTAVIRLIRKGGYAPQRTQITVSTCDRSRLRRFCTTNGNIPMIEGFSILLDRAEVAKDETSERQGKLRQLIKAIGQKAGDSDINHLVERIRQGEFDDLIYSNSQTINK